LQELDKRGVGFVEIRESTEAVGPNQHYILPHEQLADICKTLRPYYKGVIIVNQSFDPDSGIEKIRSGNADMVSFGRMYIANPDLVNRLRHNYPMNTKYDFGTFYGGGS